MKRKAKVILFMISLLIVAVAVFMGIKLYKHEKWQSAQIHVLTDQNNALQIAFNGVHINF